MSGPLLQTSNRRNARMDACQQGRVLREADRPSAAKAARKNKVSEQAIHSWRKQFGDDWLE